MKLEIVFSREKMVENNIMESVLFKNVKTCSEYRGLKYTIDDMTVVLYGQGSRNDLSSMFIIAGQLLDVEWIDNLIISSKFFKEDDGEYFEDWKKDFADTRARSELRKRKKLANG
ncbi:MAG: hypothetical protein R3Y67_09840 [Eubacteriales bacterium]